jgi:aflatoxin B1 aldehyde reductase
LGAVNAPSRFSIHTKILSGMPGSPSSSRWHSRDAIAASIEKSLKDLGIDSVETMFLHVPERETPWEETLRAIDEAHAEGKFKKFGLSNYRADEVKGIIEVCEREGLLKPSV